MIEQLIKDIKRYLDLRVTKVKLAMVEKLALIFSKTLSLVAFILLIGMALLLFTGALVVLVHAWVNSWLWAFVIMGGFYLVVALVFFFTRETMFSGAMVKTFSKIFFGRDDEDDNDDEEDDYED